MMNIKIIEIRDTGTFIPVLCVEMTSTNSKEKYLLNRLGFGGRRPIQLLVWISASHTEYDPFNWIDRTLFNARSDVVDVQYILGETDEPKLSERLNELPWES